MARIRATAATLLCSISVAVLAQTDPTIVVSSPVPTNNALRVGFTGEPGVLYTLIQSSNLTDWVAVATNSSPSVTRQVEVPLDSDCNYFQVVRERLPLFGSALTAISNIDLTGNNIFADSYDSGTGLYSIGRKANGHVASVNGIAHLGNVIVRGSLFTGPQGTSSVNTIGINGSVGDLTWKGPGIQDGHYRNDYNVSYPSVQLPPAAWLTPSGAMINKQVSGITYNYIFPASGDYVVSGFTGRFYVFSNATVNLHVTSSVVFSGTSVIEATGSLNMYVGGANSSIGAGSGVNNSEFRPLSFSYFGLPSNTNITLSLSSPLYGLVYAPQANLTMSGIGTLYGAVVANNITITGNQMIHFDENVLTNGPTR